MTFDIVVCFVGILLIAVGLANLYLMGDFKKDINTKLDRVVQFYKDDRKQLDGAMDKLDNRMYEAKADIIKQDHRIKDLEGK